MDTDRIESRQQLDQLAKEFRYIVTDIMCRAGGGHIGGSRPRLSTPRSLRFLQRWWATRFTRPVPPWSSWETRSEFSAFPKISGLRS